jgi:hypothetical protein
MTKFYARIGRRTTERPEQPLGLDNAVEITRERSLM